MTRIKRHAYAQRGQTIYQTMLIIACVMLAIAIFFPVYEYVTLYRGEAAPDSMGVSTPREATPQPAGPAEEAEGTPAAPAEQPEAPEEGGPGARSRGKLTPATVYNGILATERTGVAG